MIKELEKLEAQSNPQQQSTLDPNNNSSFLAGRSTY